MAIVLLLTGVSIPVWCDLEPLGYAEAITVNLFQFQYGAIWRPDVATRGCKQILFQFQYGAIWRAGFFKIEKMATKFQFQYGAIWSHGGVTVGSGLTCFNSSMVRFGACSIQKTIVETVRFNSSMVRFGVSEAGSKESGLLLFQFQYGAIWRSRKRHVTRR